MHLGTTHHHDLTQPAREEAEVTRKSPRRGVYSRALPGAKASTVEERLLWRQSIIAARLIGGTYDQMHESLLREAEDLNLSPVDMSWTKALHGG